MKCAVHSDVDATGYCRNCGKAMCSACARPIRDVLYCEDCLATVMGHPPAAASAPTTPPAPSASAPPPAAQPGQAYPPPAGTWYQRHGTSSPGAAFVLGLFPGLGAIYNGQYNKGLIHIAIFASIIVGLSSGMDDSFIVMLALFLAGFVFYCAFEAMRTAQAKNKGETPTDPLEAWSTGRPLGPIILIAIGALLLLNNFRIFDFIRFGRLWPLILIGAGLYMFRNKIGGQN